MTNREIIKRSIESFRVTVGVARRKKDKYFDDALKLRSGITQKIFLLHDIGVISTEKMFLLDDIIDRMIFDEN